MLTLLKSLGVFAMNIRIPAKVTYLFAFAFLIIAIGLVVAQPAVAQRSGIYHLVAHSNQNSNAGVFRINEATGQVSFCFVDGSNAANVTVRCTPEVE
jgi:hypothetical protein